jgi:hypothetical protein
MGTEGNRSLVAVACCIGLAACGGGDDDDLDIALASDGRVLSGSADIEPEDFVGRTFPAMYAGAEDASPQALTESGVGSVEVLDTDTIVVSLPGGAPRTFGRISATEFSDGFGDTLTFEDLGAVQYFFKSAGDPASEILGVFGFETPVSLRPVSARYGATSASHLFIVPSGSERWVPVFGSGTLDLIARFDGSGGRISGTLIDASQTVDFMGDGVADDQLSVRTTLDGVINKGGFDGTFAGSASVYLPGYPGPQDLNPVLSSPTASGKFFGPSAGIVSGTYGGDYTFANPIPGAPASGSFTGLFIATE